MGECGVVCGGIATAMRERRDGLLVACEWELVDNDSVVDSIVFTFVIANN